MSPAQTTETPLAGRPDFEKLLYDFDKAWRRGQAPRMEAFLPPAAETDPARRQCVAELAKIDLEYRWWDPLGRTPSRDGLRLRDDLLELSQGLAASGRLGKIASSALGGVAGG